MVVILLAGGKGLRLEESGRTTPKPLINILNRPVINIVVDKLLALDKVEQIYVVLPSHQRVEGSLRAERELSLKEEFASWKDAWYQDNAKVEIKLEDEELPDTVALPSAIKAVEGMTRFLMQNGYDDRNRVLLLAADNIFEDDLNEFIAEGDKWPSAIINAYSDLLSPTKVQNKFAALAVDDSGWIEEYIEKPPNTTLTKASSAIYSFPFVELKRVLDYCTKADTKGAGPGSFIQWLFAEEGFPRDDPRNPRIRRGIRGYELKGRWSDIGDRQALAAAVVWYVNSIFNRLETAKDLLLADEAQKLDDRHFFLCWDLQVDAESRVVRLFVRDDDPICSLRRPIGKAKEVRSATVEAAADPIWNKLLAAFGDGTSLARRRLTTPVLLSGGVCLVDGTIGPGAREDNSDYNTMTPQRALIPLLEKDPGAPSDPGRMTTSAGRMDRLDMESVCFSEQEEEFVFYGAGHSHDQTVLYWCGLPQHQDGAKRRLLARLVERRIEVPGIDLDAIKGQSVLPDNMIDLVEVITAQGLILPKRLAWTVEVYLNEKVQTRSHGFCVIPDKQNGTLEFRLVAGCDLSRFNPRIGIDRFSKRVGRLAGIVDGDGYGRRVFLVQASSLVAYYHRMRKLTKEDLLDYIFTSQKESLEVLAVGDGRTGRFSQFKAPVPLVTFTTSLRHLMDATAMVLQMRESDVRAAARA